MKAFLVIAILLASNVTFAQGRDRDRDNNWRDDRGRGRPHPGNFCDLSRQNEVQYVGVQGRVRFDFIAADTLVRDIMFASALLRNQANPQHNVDVSNLISQNRHGYDSNGLALLMYQHILVAPEYQVQLKRTPGHEGAFKADFAYQVVDRLNEYARGMTGRRDSYEYEQAACLINNNRGHLVLAKAANIQKLQNDFGRRNGRRDRD